MEQASNGQLPLTNYQLRARRDKSRYLEEIRLNWGADIEDRIPASIHPRKTLTPHRKPRVGDIAEIEDDPRNWSLELLRLLRNLSRKQVASLATMQDLVETEVRLRQSSTTTNKYKLAAEVIIDDVQRVIDGIDKRHASDETER
ncbi:hypothetical protein W97_09317 [Coniosporium apollinis CBS 100218]|uniref:Uncharacterized protein n=1 Tax=Coniosporium apollinis (strain CBS 100218) TaxID=1168221 RepID=R7Z7P4_CONA1|nr:uncharacterized protein W97_09317 [Coniosporium apollinis CBS 100218]EON70049.1 hypothetical protein W97_09317 [Coniosporium apollinis CBS 100218]